MHCAGFLSQWLLLLQSTGSRAPSFRSCGSQALEQRFNSCGTRAELPCSIGDPPGSGIEFKSPAFMGRFFTPSHQGSPNITEFSHWKGSSAIWSLSCFWCLLMGSDFRVSQECPFLFSLAPLIPISQVLGGSLTLLFLPVSHPNRGSQSQRLPHTVVSSWSFRTFVVDSLLRGPQYSYPRHVYSCLIECEQDLCM